MSFSNWGSSLAHSALSAALVKGNIERPPDFDGVVYISLDKGNCKIDLSKELAAAGYDIDWKKAAGA